MERNHSQHRRDKHGTQEVHSILLDFHIWICAGEKALQGSEEKNFELGMDKLIARFVDSRNYNMLLEGDKSVFRDLKGHGTQDLQICPCNTAHERISMLRASSVDTENYNSLGFDPYHLFQFIEKFTFQYSVVCKLPGNRVEKIYSKYALEIHEAARNRDQRKNNSKIAVDIF